MFSNSKNESKGKTNGIVTPSSSSSNMLVQGTTVEGTLAADNDIRIDGTLRGNLNCKGKVVIGPTGYISGEVTCENAVIEGRFEGTIYVGDVLHVKETAKVEGDVATQKLVVQPGSIFNVKCKMGSSLSGPSNSKKSTDAGDAIELNSLSKAKATMS